MTGYCTKDTKYKKTSHISVLHNFTQVQFGKICSSRVPFVANSGLQEVPKELKSS